MASEYRLVSYTDGAATPKAGVLVGERVVPAATLLQGADGIDSSSVLGLLRAWDSTHPRLHAAAQKVQPNDGIALAQVKLLANIDLEISFDLVKLANFAELAIKLNSAFNDIRNLDETATAARLKELVPALLEVSNCRDFVTDRGHLFGTGLADDDKRALIAYLKRL